MVENLTMDRQGGNPNRRHLYGLEELNEIKQICNLIDIWRTQNSFQTKFNMKTTFWTLSPELTVFIFAAMRKKNLAFALT